MTSRICLAVIASGIAFAVASCGRNFDEPFSGVAVEASQDGGVTGADTGPSRPEAGPSGTDASLDADAQSVCPGPVCNATHCDFACTGPNCGCNSTCTSGKSCTYECKDGASCNIVCPDGASGCDVTCRAGSSCKVDCERGPCTLRCEGDAKCSMGCGSGSCSTICGDDAEDVSCGGGRKGCNACP